MKHLIILVTALTTLTASAQIGVDAIAKQRARDVANQNANRSLQPPGATAARPAAPAVSATPLTPAQQAYANFQTQLFGVGANVTADQKSALAREMGSVAQGAKPSQATLTKLSDHLTTALAESTKLTTPKKTRLAQDVAVLLNSANTPPTQKDAMIKDVQSILESGGASAENASAVAVDLKSVTDEIKPAAK
ncbi:MAG TPA: hypothetical protein VHC44_12595 [Verrucomicrobiae bacterium]|nr:hypothetical protein [Verrucomicrobiae bacterium]